MIIDVTLDDCFEEKFQYLEVTENKSAAEVLQEALEAYFALKLDQNDQADSENRQGSV